jgi:glycerol uptake facilitator-like aquaporin
VSVSEKVGTSARERAGRAYLAEALGAMMLAAIVIGSGVMAERLSGGNVAIALLGNTLATAAGLVALILSFSAVSGAHFNPAVSLVMVLRGELPRARLPGYVAAQLAGMVLGAFLVHAMFALPILQTSQKLRAGSPQLLSECVATFCLLLTILRVNRSQPRYTPFAVAAIITAGYWFTASTSFANPAITIARCLSDTFAGIAPINVPGFIAAQLIGALLAWWLDNVLAE